MSEKVALAVKPHGGGWRHPDPRVQNLPVKAAVEFWRARRGYLIHRARSARVFLRPIGPAFQGGHMHVDFWCGNGTNEPIPFRPECGEGLKPCDACDRAYRKRGPA